MQVKLSGERGKTAEWFQVRVLATQSYPLPPSPVPRGLAIRAKYSDSLRTETHQHRRQAIEAWGPG